MSRATEQALKDCVITIPRNSFDRIHNAAINELLNLRVVNAALVKALEGAHEWLSGWASAEGYIEKIEAALKAAKAQS